MVGKLAIFGFVMFLFAMGARAETIAEKAQICARCHGENGKPTDKTIPTIWGQQAGYLYIQLRDFKRGDRKSEIMQPMTLSIATRCWRSRSISRGSHGPISDSRAHPRTWRRGRSMPAARSAARPVTSTSSRAMERYRASPAWAAIISPRPSPISAREHAPTTPECPA